MKTENCSHFFFYKTCAFYEQQTVYNSYDSILSGCPAGFQGPNCALSCDPPYYGKECQLECACKGGETCHPSFGCILPTTTTTTIIETTTKITTTVTKMTTTEGIITIIYR